MHEAVSPVSVMYPDLRPRATLLTDICPENLAYQSLLASHSPYVQRPPAASPRCFRPSSPIQHWAKGELSNSIWYHFFFFFFLQWQHGGSSLCPAVTWQRTPFLFSFSYPHILDVSSDVAKSHAETQHHSLFQAGGHHPCDT